MAAAVAVVVVGVVVVAIVTTALPATLAVRVGANSSLAPHTARNYIY